MTLFQGGTKLPAWPKVSPIDGTCPEPHYTISYHSRRRSHPQARRSEEEMSFSGKSQTERHSTQSRIKLSAKTHRDSTQSRIVRNLGSPHSRKKVKNAELYSVLS